MNEVDNRQFIRHPSNIPIEYCFVDRPLVVSDSTNNVSAGGLSFRANQYIEPNSWLHLHIPIHHEYFEIDARVRWCQPRKDNAYDVGVNFNSDQEAFSARMVEQACYIEQYKKDVFEAEGRVLSSDEAATEWITRFANQFPAQACSPRGPTSSSTE